MSIKVTDSIVSVGGNNFIKLDQTTPQTILNGFPVYEDGHSAFTLDHQIVDKEYVDQAVTAINVHYYMLDSASGVSDYKDTQVAIPSESEANDPHTVTADDQYLRGWISPVGSAPSKLVAGIYNLYLEADVNQTSGYKRVRIYWKLVEYKADTSEVVIGTSENSDEITTSQTDYNIHLVLSSDYTVTSGSRIVGKLYADLSGSGNDPQVTIYYLGSINSRWEVPSSTEVLDGLYLKLDQTTYQTISNGKPYFSSGIVVDSGLGSGFSVDIDDTYISIACPSGSDAILQWTNDGTGTVTCGIDGTDGSWAISHDSVIPTSAAYRISTTRTHNFVSDASNGGFQFQGDGTILTSGQILVMGKTNSNQQFWFGYDTDSDFGILAAILQGSAWKPVYISPYANGNVIGLNGTTNATYALNVSTHMRIGIGAAGVDYYILFDGQSSDGYLYWMEDETWFRFTNNVTIDTLTAGQLIYTDANKTLAGATTLTFNGTNFGWSGTSAEATADAVTFTTGQSNATDPAFAVTRTSTAAYSRNTTVAKFIDLATTAGNPHLYLENRTGASLNSAGIFGLRDHQTFFQVENGYKFKFEQWGGSLGDMEANDGYFATVQLSDLTASKPVFTDASKNLTSSGTMPVDQGGTGATSYTKGDILVATGATTLAKLGVGNDDEILTAASGEASGIKWGNAPYTNLTSFVDQTAWRIFYSDTNGDVTELALGDDGEYLMSNGAAVAPSWETPAGGGTEQITFIIDGGEGTPETGVAGYMRVPFDGTITGWTIVADQSGSCVIDVWMDSYANFPPTVADTIAGSEKPTLSSAQKNQDLALGTWTTAVTAGDILAFNVDSVSTVTKIYLYIDIDR